MSDFSQGPGWWQASDGKWYPPEQAPGAAPGGGSPMPGTGGGVDIGGAISYGWNKFTQNAGPLIVAVLLIWVVSLVINGIGWGINSFIATIILSIIAIAISAVVGYGLANIALKITRGEPVAVSDALPSGPNVANYAITAIVVQVIVTIGLWLCIIPGVIAAAYLWWAHFVAIDEGLPVGDALGRSAELAKDNLGKIFGFMIVAFLINIVGAILCGVGLLVTIPLTTVAAAFVYRGLKGEPVAA